MTNDAKLGLVIGLALVLVISMVFFRRDTQVAAANLPTTPATVITAKAAE